MIQEYTNCLQCPRFCNTARNDTIKGYCGETSELRIAWAGLHFGEEPPITGKNGSGTIFITGCNLGCVFCQNYQISHEGMGKAVSSEEFAEICLALQQNKAENINIVTGSHVIPGIVQGLKLATLQGLKLPVLWNSSAYESVEALSRLEGLVQVWLPDLKTLNPLLSGEVFKAQDYPKVAKKALRWMAEQSPLVFTDKDGQKKITSGLIVRHLALPGRFSDTEMVLRWFSKNLQGKALLSLMSQYTPVSKSKTAQHTAFPNRHLEQAEYDTLLALLEELCIEDGFYQELIQDTEWLPDFTNTQPFSSSLATPIWHWKTGFILNGSSKN